MDQLRRQRYAQGWRSHVNRPASDHVRDELQNGLDFYGARAHRHPARSLLDLRHRRPGLRGSVHGHNSYSGRPTAWSVDRLNGQDEGRLDFGGGAEYALCDNITLKAEALWFDLGSISLNANAPALTTSSLDVDQKIEGVIARAGVGYKF